MTRPRFKVPHTLVLLFGMIVVGLLLTYVLPQGTFERVENEQGREQVVANSYQESAERKFISPWGMLKSIPVGFERAQDIIFFVFIVGGAFAVFRATGTADAIIGFVLAKAGSRPGLLIAGGILLFAVGSSTIGMAEEYLPFVPMLIALAIALGYDAVTAVGILCVGYSIGYGCAAINPFTVMIAQNVAGIQEGSGIAFRLVLTVAFLAVGIHHVWRYAVRVRENPANSLLHGIDSGKHEARAEYPAINATHVTVTLVSVAFVGVLLYGLLRAHWYLIEMGALFVLLSIAIGLVARLGLDRTAIAFCKGAAELTTTALLIGFARTIQVVLDEGQVVDTIINAVAQPLQQTGAHIAAVGMFLVQSLCNFFIPSGSGQAYVTMPIMAPLADLVGVSRQVSVLAYQFGDGFTNILVPTNAVLIGILTMAGVPYDRWVRFVMPFMVKVWILGSIALVVAVLIGYS